MDNLFSKYFFEREGFETRVLMGAAFATFRVQGADKEELYIRDIFVHPEFRKKRLASELADQIFEIAKQRGCKYVAGTVCPAAGGSSESMQVMLAYGFKIRSSDAEKIVLVKEIT